VKGVLKKKTLFFWLDRLARRRRRRRRKKLKHIDRALPLLAFLFLLFFISALADTKEASDRATLF